MKFDKRKLFPFTYWYWKETNIVSTSKITIDLVLWCLFAALIISFILYPFQ